MIKDRALAIIFAALEDLNEELEDGQKVEISAHTPLFGANAAIDSLSLVSLIVDIEQVVSEETGSGISLTDERAINSTPSPFTNPSLLAEYIEGVTAEQAGHVGP